VTNPVDQAISDWVFEHRTPWLTSVAWKLTAVGSTTVVAVGAVLVGVVLAVKRRSWIPLVACIAAAFAVEVTARSIKALVHRDRPPYDDAIEHLARSSFPAAHVARAALLCALVVMLLPRRWRVVTVPLAIVTVTGVAWSRVYLGSHWFTDTLVAWPIGLLAACVVYAVALR